MAISLAGCGGGGSDGNASHGSGQSALQGATQSAATEATASTFEVAQSVLTQSLETDAYLRAVNLLSQTSANRGILIDNFDSTGSDTGNVPGWSYDRGAEFPGSNGSLTLTRGAAGTPGAARLNVDLSCGSTVMMLRPVGRCGNYVGMTRRLPAMLPIQNPETALLQLRIRSSHPLITGTIRVVDGSGQTLQFRMPPNTPESASGADWSTVAVSLARAFNHWGGANDGRIRDGITQISVLATVPYLTAPPGHIMVDDMRLLDNGMTDHGVTRQAPVLSSGATLQLGKRATVSSHFYHMSDSALKQAAEAGFSSVRLDIFWDMVETRGRFDFTAFDAILTRLAKYGLSAHFILAYGHPDYGRSAPTTPSARAAFVEYARRVTAFSRGRNVTALEVWNEPDNTTFWTNGDPVTYSELLGATRDAIKAVDPTRKVVNGGPSWVSLPYILNLAQTGQLAGLDGFAIHPYRRAAPETFGTDFLSMKAILASQNLDLPIWSTEWGTSSVGVFDTALFGDGHDARARDRQGVVMVRNYLAQIAQNLPVVTLYELVDSGRDPNHPEHNYGLLTTAMTPKPAYTAIKTLNDLIAPRSYRGMVANLPANVHSMRWDSPTDSVFAVWVSSARTTLNLHVPPGASVKNWKGQAVSTAPTSNGTHTVRVAEATGPVYVTLPVGQ